MKEFRETKHRSSTGLPSHAPTVLSRAVTAATIKSTNKYILWKHRYREQFRDESDQHISDLMVLQEDVASILDW